MKDTEESWLRLSMDYPEPTDENAELYFFEEELYALLYSCGASTINEQDSSTLDGRTLPVGQKRLLCYFDKEQAVHAAEVKTAVEQAARRAGVDLKTSMETFTDQTWKDGWKAFFKPAQVSPHIGIRTPWLELNVPEGVHVIVIEPGMAFGTGLHETTQLCLKAIDEISSSGKVASMLDVGCGSGVLAIAASMCGVPVVRGVDNDPVCVEVSRENAETNGVSVQFDGTDIWDISEKYELVVANIISSVLKALKNDIRDACIPGGRVVLSGILAEEREEVEQAFLEDGGLEKIAHAVMGEWCSVSFKRV